MYKLINLKKGKTYFIKDTTKDFSFDIGVLKKEEILSDEVFFKIRGLDYMKVKFNFNDFHQNIKREAQIITKKDIGYILVKSAIDKDSKILEAGSGSCSLTIYFSKFCNSVKTYEINEKHFLAAKKNIEDFKLENTKILNEDLFLNLEEKEKNQNYDLIFLDMLNPQEIFNFNLDNILKINQYICIYIPSVSQIIEIYNKVDKDKFLIEEVCEITKRDWKITQKISHPKNRKELDFSAFLIFIRKLK